MIDFDAGQKYDVSANVMDNLDHMFVEESLWEGEFRSSFTADDRSVIAFALTQLSKKVHASGSDRANLLNV